MIFPKTIKQITRLERLLDSIDEPESLQQCRIRLEQRMVQLCIARAQQIAAGDRIVVTVGPLTGRPGTVISRSYRVTDAVLVVLDEVDLEVPIPIPVWALRARGQEE